jgi:hypothetical protein
MIVREIITNKRALKKRKAKPITTTKKLGT